MESCAALSRGGHACKGGDIPNDAPQIMEIPRCDDCALRLLFKLGIPGKPYPCGGMCESGTLQLILNGNVAIFTPCILPACPGLGVPSANAIHIPRCVACSTGQMTLGGMYVRGCGTSGL